MEVDSRRRKKLEMESVINEKLNELDRITQQYEALCKVELEQIALMDSLSKGSGGGESKEM